MRISQGNKILAEGKIDFPQAQHFIPSEFYPLPENAFLLNSISVTDRTAKGPVFALKWDLKTKKLTLDDKFFSLPVENVHARNLALSPDRDFMILADHGSDLEPFPGGFSKYFQLQNGAWKVENLLETAHFHFDVSISNKVKRLKNLIVLTNLNSFENSLLTQNKEGHFEVVPDAWPKELNFSHWISAHFCDLDQDGEDELILGTREGQEKDLILKWDGYRFETTSMNLPKKRNIPWETVSLQTIDLNGDGKQDIVSLNHDKKIQHGSLEVYLNNDSFTLMAMDQKLSDYDKVKNRWIHRSCFGTFQRGKFPSLALLGRMADYSLALESPLLFFALNLDGKGLEYAEYDLFRDEKGLLGHAIGDFNSDGKEELLLLRFDGYWTVSSINQFN